MSASSISQILQAVTSRSESKPPAAADSQGQEFQKLLARASQSGEESARAPSDPDVPASDQPTSDSAGNDSHGPDHNQTATDVEAVVLSTESDVASEDVAGDELQDELVLSAAALVVTIPVTTAAPPQFVGDTAEPQVVTNVIDATASELPPEGAAGSPLEVAQFTQTLDVMPAAEEVIPAPENTADATAEVANEQQIVKVQPTTQIATESSGKNTQSQTSAAGTKAEVAVQGAADSVRAALPKAPGTSKPTKPAATAVQSSEPVATDKATNEAEAVEESADVEPPVVAIVEKLEAELGGEAKHSTDKELGSEARAPELTPISHTPNDNATHATRSTDASTTDSSSQAGAVADSDPISTVDRARFVQRVSRAFQSAQSRDGTIQLRLSPPELGGLRIAITTQHGVLSAKIEADTVAARNVILDNLPALRERLAEQQIRLERFDVDVRRDGNQSSGNWESTDRQARQSDNSAQQNRLRPSVAAAPHVPRQSGRVSDSGLDVRI